MCGRVYERQGVGIKRGTCSLEREPMCLTCCGYPWYLGPSQLALPLRVDARAGPRQALRCACRWHLILLGPLQPAGTE